VLKEKVRLESLAREFQALARQRAMQRPGMLEHRHSAEWQATPAVLREAIERFNWRVTVAGKPSDDLASGTLNSILKQSGLKK
jgi:hypothetical protein